MLFSLHREVIKKMYMLFYYFKFLMSEHNPTGNLFEEHNITKQDYIKNFFKQENIDFSTRGKECKFRCLWSENDYILGVIWKKTIEKSYADYDFEQVTDLEKRDYTLLLINTSTILNKDASQVICMENNKGFNEQLLKSLIKKMESEKYSVFLNPITEIKEKFWNIAGKEIISKLNITYTPKNLFNHEDDLAIASKEANELFHSDGLGIVLKNKDGLKIEKNNNLLDGFLDYCEKGGGNFSAYSGTKTVFNSSNTSNIKNKNVNLTISTKALTKDPNAIKELISSLSIDTDNVNLNIV